jgi:hypothetical protein
MGMEKERMVKSLGMWRSVWVYWVYGERKGWFNLWIYLEKRKNGLIFGYIEKAKDSFIHGFVEEGKIGLICGYVQKATNGFVSGYVELGNDGYIYVCKVLRKGADLWIFKPGKEGKENKRVGKGGMCVCGYWVKPWGYSGRSYLWG